MKKLVTLLILLFCLCTGLNPGLASAECDVRTTLAVRGYINAEAAASVLIELGASRSLSCSEIQAVAKYAPFLQIDATVSRASTALIGSAGQSAAEVRALFDSNGSMSEMKLGGQVRYFKFDGKELEYFFEAWLSPNGLSEGSSYTIDTGGTWLARDQTGKVQILVVARGLQFTWTRGMGPQRLILICITTSPAPGLGTPYRLKARLNSELVDMINRSLSPEEGRSRTPPEQLREKLMAEVKVALDRALVVAGT